MVISYKCPSCGGMLSFDIDSQLWKCFYCNSDFTLEALSDANTVKEPDTKDFEQNQTEFAREGAKAYNCPSCGAQIVTDTNTAATFCVFCKSPTLISEKLEGKYKPVRLIPFKLNRDKAQEAFRKLCNRPFVPFKFRKKDHVDQIKGLYVPFWFFDCSCQAQASFHCENYTRWSDSKNNYVKTDIYRVLREGKFTFNSIPADGSSKLDDSMMQAIEPFDSSQLVPFEMQYLSGHLAECYDMSAKEVFPQVEKRVRSGVESAIRNSVSGYASVRLEKLNCLIYEANPEYVMMPVWVLVSKHKKKDYIFAMNAQSGKIVGKLPVSAKRVFAWWGIIAAVAAIIFEVVKRL